MATQPTSFLTEADYLELERRAETRSEYHNGQMYAMAGGTVRHARINTNIVVSVWPQLQGKPCEVFSSDLRLRVTAEGLYTYPDVMVVCGEIQYADDRRDTILNPVVIIEVLSPSTQHYDRGQKFDMYRSLPSLAEYLTISQDKPRIARWARQPEGGWLLTDYAGLDQSIPLPSIGGTLSSAGVYDKVDWTA